MKRKQKTSIWRRWRVPLLTAILAGAVLIGYQVVAQSSGTGTQSPANAASSERSIVTLDGKTIAFPQAGKPSAVYFFTTTCTTCLPGLRDLAAAAAKHPEVVYVPVSVNPYDDANKVHWFLTAARDENRAAALDPEARLARVLQASALGTLIVFDRSGATVYRGIDPAADVVAAAFAKAVK